MLTKTKPARSESYLDYIRRLPCAAAPTIITKNASDCIGMVHAHHHGSHGTGQKCSDFRTIPLCHQHHIVEFHGKGTLWGWTRDLTDSWIQEQIIQHLERYIVEMGEVEL